MNQTDLFKLMAKHLSARIGDIGYELTEQELHEIENVCQVLRWRAAGTKVIDFDEVTRNAGC